MSFDPTPDHSLKILLKGDVNTKMRHLRVDYAFYSSPLGRCFIGRIADRICYMALVEEDEDGEDLLADLSRHWPGASLVTDNGAIGRMLADIFRNPDRGVAETKLLVRATGFQSEVWKALLKIPAGDLKTYAEVAHMIGRPKAVRAVASAVGANPIAWLIPCHRVVRTDGRLGGYRWGIARKKMCLEFEKRRTAVQV